MHENLAKFDICYITLPEPKAGSCIQGGSRPVIIVSNDVCDKYSPIVSVVPLTTRQKKRLPTHVDILGFGLPQKSTVMCEQITSIDKSSITSKIGNISNHKIRFAINKALQIQLAV